MNLLPRTIPRSKFWMTGFFPGILYTSMTELDHIIEYHDSTATFIESEGRQFKKSVEDYIKASKLNEEQKDFYYDFKQDEFNMLHSFFPDALRYSILILSCTLFESTLVNVCKQLERDTEIQTKQSWASINKGSVLERAMKALKDNYMVDLSLHVNWATIKDIFELRHCIAHANGEIGLTKKPEKIKNIIKKYADQGLDELSEYRLSIKQEFIPMAIEKMREFINDLEKAFIDNDIVGKTYWP